MMYEVSDEPWTVRDEDFPWGAAASEQLKFMLNYAVLAPSIYNIQPWLFKVTGSEVAMYLDPTRALPVCDPKGRNLIISCGAALFHLRVAIRHFGYEPVVRTFPDLDSPNLLAYVRLGTRKEATLQDHRLFMAIRRRRTIRSTFLAKAVPAGVLQHLQDAAEQEGGRLFVVGDRPQRSVMTNLIQDAYDIRHSDGPFKRELDRWSSARWDRRPVGQMNYPVLKAGVAAPSTSLGSHGLDRRQLLAWDEELEAGEPAFVVLCTSADKMPSWLSAGQALSRVLLTAANYNLNAAFLSQAVGIDHLRTRVAELVGGGVYPQVILRVGYGAPGMPTRRLPIQRVVPDA